VYRKIKKQLPQINTLELQYVSPKLLSARDFELAVPGTYRAGEPIVRISSFAPTLSVFNTKQRPRKLTIHGSDGVEYVFLLKGTEEKGEKNWLLYGLSLVYAARLRFFQLFEKNQARAKFPFLPCKDKPDRRRKRKQRIRNRK
jgi:FKBP12-rapamycin complex-associated protein